MWVGPSTSMMSWPPGHDTSASTDRLPSPTTAEACRTITSCQVLVATVYLTKLPHCLTISVAPSILPALPTSMCW
jgi:hypothetical protein